MQRTQLSALCLVPTRVLLDQWSREIGAVYRGAIGCYGDGVRRVAPVTVATFEGAYRHMHEIGDRFDLLIVDEVHHFGGGLRDEALEMALADARLGLTATPPRDAGAAASLAELVGPTVFELAVGDLAGGFLASFDAITLYLDLGPEERSAYANLSALFTGVYAEFRRAAPEASWADWSRHAAGTPTGRRALAAWRQMRRLLSFTHAKRRALRALLERQRDAKVLVFTADNDTAYAIARAHLIMPLTCDIGRPEREDVLERFRGGDLRTLVSARVLNEGLDVPDADVAIIVGGALGEREHVQRIGRLLRPGEGKRATAYELVTRNTIEVGQARRRRRGPCYPIVEPAIAWRGPWWSLTSLGNTTIHGCAPSSRSTSGSSDGPGAIWMPACASHSPARARPGSSPWPFKSSRGSSAAARAQPPCQPGERGRWCSGRRRGQGKLRPRSCPGSPPHSG